MSRCLLLFLLVSSCFTSSALAFKTKWYKVKPPGKLWLEQTAYPGTDVAFLSAESKHLIHPVFTLTTSKNIKPRTNWARLIRQQIQVAAKNYGYKPSLEILKSWAWTSKKKKIYVTTYQYDQNGVSLQELVALIPHGDVVHMAHFSAPADLFDKYYEQGVKNTLRSIRFLK